MKIFLYLILGIFVGGLISAWVVLLTHALIRYWFVCKAEYESKLIHKVNEEYKDGKKQEEK